MIGIIVYLLIFIVGEFLFNLTWFNYLKSYFKSEEMNMDTNKIKPKKFLLLNLSTFKGVMERFILSIGLIAGFAPILIVFGTIKLGTRFKETLEIKNDYFLIGNFSSILISILYYFIHNQVMQNQDL